MRLERRLEFGKFFPPKKLVLVHFRENSSVRLELGETVKLVESLIFVDLVEITRNKTSV